MFKKMLAVGFVIAACVFGVNAATIQGIVIDQDSVPVPGATVTITRTGLTTIVLTTDSLGGYSVDNLTASTSQYNINTSKIGYVSPANPVQRRIQGSADLFIVDLQLRVRRLSGIITDSASTKPINNVMVALKRGETLIDSTFTDTLGAYAFVAAANNDTVIASQPFYLTKQARLTYAAATLTVTQNFSLHAFGNLFGRVSADSATGAPIGGVKILITRIVNGVPEQRPFDSTLTDTTIIVDTPPPSILPLSFGQYELDTLDAYIFYQITAMKSGYDSKTVILNGKTRGWDTVNFVLPTIRTIRGTVGRDSTDGETTTLIPIRGAKVTLLRNSTPLDSMIVDSLGMYAFTKSAYTPDIYTVTASALHYIPGTVIDTLLPSDLVDTANIHLVLAQGTIAGVVTADSATGQKLVGAKVRLLLGEKADSTTTDTAGAYSFVNLEAHLNYSLTASANGYNPLTVPLNNKAVGLDVVNFVLTPGANKTFWVKVIKTADTVIPGASVGISTNSGTVYNGGVTNDSGVATIYNTPIGGYTITVAKVDFITNFTTFYNLSAHSADTVTITLTAGIQTSKTLTGRIMSIGKLPGPQVSVQNALIKVRATNVLSFSAMTDSLGNYTITGIPTNITSIAIGNLTVTRTINGVVDTNFKVDTTNRASIALGASGTPNTTTFNTSLRWTGSVVGICPAVNFATSGAPDFGILRSGTIRMQNMVKQGMVKVFNLRGQMVYEHSFEANTASMNIPILSQSKNMFIVRISQENEVFTKMIMIP